jgi:hypothetical protein
MMAMMGVVTEDTIDHGKELLVENVHDARTSLPSNQILIDARGTVLQVWSAQDDYSYDFHILSARLEPARALATAL